jgi:hypothetical protein
LRLAHSLATRLGIQGPEVLVAKPWILWGPETWLVRDLLYFMEFVCHVGQRGRLSFKGVREMHCELEQLKLQRMLGYAHFALPILLEHDPYPSKVLHAILDGKGNKKEDYFLDL